MTKGDPLYDANDNTSWCLYFDEISFFIVNVSFFEIFNEWQSLVAVDPKQNKIPNFEKELHAPYSKLNAKSSILVNLQPINFLIYKILSQKISFSCIYLSLSIQSSDDIILTIQSCRTRCENFSVSVISNQSIIIKIPLIKNLYFDMTSIIIK